MIIDDYTKPATVAEAYRLLQEHADAAVVGGGAMLRLGKRRIGLAIDLFEAGLDFISLQDGVLELGAMATYRQLETHPAVQTFAGGILGRSIRDITGVQQRNIFTVGGTVQGKYGFSNLLTILTALDATVVFHGAGAVPLTDHLAQEGRRRDIVEKITIPTGDLAAGFAEATRTRSDFALLNAAAVRRDGRWRIAVGARPRKPALALQAMAHLDGGGEARRAGDLAAKELTFGSDVRASADYRRQVAAPLVARAIEEVPA